MGLYLGKKKLCSYNEKKVTQNSMKMLFDSISPSNYYSQGTEIDAILSPFARSGATSFKGWWQQSDTANVKKWNYMFAYCSSLQTLPTLDMTSATSARFLFYECSKLRACSIMNANNLIDAYGMFYECSSLEEVNIDIPSANNAGFLLFDAAHNVEDCVVNLPNATDINGLFRSTLSTASKSVRSVKKLYAPKASNCSYIFYWNAALTKIEEIDISSATTLEQAFYACSKLTEIPAINTSNVTTFISAFSGCKSLEYFHAYGMKVSFDISSSTKFTESALVEILNNLASVTNTQKLTMGSTNLAKLTDNEKAIATGKGWTLA